MPILLLKIKQVNDILKLSIIRIKSTNALLPAAKPLLKRSDARYTKIVRFGVLEKG